jgi:lipoate-protein ligase A
VLDGDRVARAGIEVVRRASGGGAVLVVPGSMVWVDLAIPAGDPLWEADVGKAFWWVGDLWAAALMALGQGPCRVHRGGLVPSPWSRLVCFAGLGPGEVTLGGRKAVGLSQRRTRAGAVFHGAALLEVRAHELVSLLDLAPAEQEQAVSALEAGVAALPVQGRDLESALLDRLP